MRTHLASSTNCASVDAQYKQLIKPAVDEYLADKIDSAELDRRKAAARAKATGEHPPLKQLDTAFGAYKEKMAALAAAEAEAEEAAEAVDAAVRQIEGGQPVGAGPSSV